MGEASPHLAPARIEAVMGIDYGRRRIGIATGQTITGTATPGKTIQNPVGKINWEALETRVKDWAPDCLIVGLPLAIDGSESEMTTEVRKFAAELSERTGVYVQFSDERLTSVQTDQEFVDARREGRLKRKHASNLDSSAASAILQQWLNQNG